MLHTELAAAVGMNKSGRPLAAARTGKRVPTTLTSGGGMTVGSEVTGCSIGRAATTAGSETAEGIPVTIEMTAATAPGGPVVRKIVDTTCTRGAKVERDDEHS